MTAIRQALRAISGLVTGVAIAMLLDAAGR